MPEYTFPTQEEIDNLSKFVLRKKEKNVQLLQKDALQWTRTAWENKMDYEVNWFGMPIIQNPYDIVIMQELIYTLKPDIIIEAGIAHGGSLIFYASLVTLLGKGTVIGIDTDIREHNKKLILKHPFSKKITMYEGSSTDPEILAKVKKHIKKTDKVLVILDSNHTYQHVYNELQAFKDIVTKNSYLVVFDTFMPRLNGLDGAAKDVTQNNPGRAATQFLQENKNFTIDKTYNKFFVTSCPDGFLKRIA